MSARDPVEPLLQQLANDLAPVRPVARLRTAGLAIVGVQLGIAVGYWALGGPAPRLGPGGPASDPAFLMVLAGLVATAAGALVAALAGAVPGREAASRGGFALAGAGLLVSVVGGVSLAVGAAAPLAGLSLRACLDCTGRALLLGVVPATVASLFVARAFERHPLLAGGSAALGAAALGAAIVHAGCAGGAPLHPLVAHALGPAFAGLLLGVPLALWIRRRQRPVQPGA